MSTEHERNMKCLQKTNNSSLLDKEYVVCSQIPSCQAIMWKPGAINQYIHHRCFTCLSFLPALSTPLLYPHSSNSKRYTSNKNRRTVISVLFEEPKVVVASIVVVVVAVVLMLLQKCARIGHE